MARSILGTLTLAATVLFAAPIALAGVFEIAAGEYVLGGVFLGIAALMLLFEEYLVTPSDLPILAVEEAVGAIEPSEEGNRERGDDESE